MKRIGLICAAVLMGMNLAACGSQTSKKNSTSSKTSSSKAVKHHKKATQTAKTQSSSSSSSAAISSSSQQIAQTGNASVQQSTTNTSNASQINNNEQVYTAHPSQGGTIYQTNGNTGSFQGDPDTIAATQIKMQQAAERIANGQQ